MDDAGGSTPRRGASTLGVGLARRLVPSDCLHPRLMLANDALPNLLVVVLVAAILVARPQWPVAAGPGGVEARTVLVLTIGAVVVLAGDLMPVLYRPAAGKLMRWSVPFVMAVVAYAGLVPALTLSVLGVGLLSLGMRLHPLILSANVGGSATSVLVVWGVLTAFGWRADLADPWVPSSAYDVAVLLLAVFMGEAAFNVLFVVGTYARRGTAPLLVLQELAHAYRETGGLYQLAMAPVIVVVMAEVPLLTVLMVLPVTAVHRATVEQSASDHAASHDGLTQLANRREFVAATERALLAAGRTGGRLAVLALDLDGFKQVNDELGHPVGDEVLVETARRLRAAAGPDGVVGRMGGDEFAVLLADPSGVDDALAVAARLHAEVGRPFQVHGHDLRVSVSVGVAVAPDHGDDFDSLYLGADRAMFTAKRARGAPRLCLPCGLDPSPSRRESGSLGGAAAAQRDGRGYSRAT